MAEPRGIVIAAPSSNAGKTIVTLSLLRALAGRNANIVSAKVGPDYIDPRFHEAATGRECITLDPWAMHPAHTKSLLQRHADNSEYAIIEGVMGLFDGATDGSASTADLAIQLNLPVILVVDVSRQGQSAAALIKGFRDFRPDCRITGVIINNIGSPRHRDMIAEAIASLNIPLVGALPINDAFKFPSRHLGLVQAQEHDALMQQLDRAAAVLAENIDLDLMRQLAEPISPDPEPVSPPLAPLGQRIAVARDDAFAFTYPHILNGWRDRGAELSFFSPLENQAPAGDSDAIYLPGGYPELHAGPLANAEQFFAGLKSAQTRDVLIFGECGGYMILGDYIVDAGGNTHRMAGLLPVGTNFAARKLHLGYRAINHDSPLPWPADLRGHEFHYASIDYEKGADALFKAVDSSNADLGTYGLRRGRVMGSFIHIIDHERDHGA